MDITNLTIKDFPNSEYWLQQEVDFNSINSEKSGTNSKINCGKLSLNTITAVSPVILPARDKSEEPTEPIFDLALICKHITEVNPTAITLPNKRKAKIKQTDIFKNNNPVPKKKNNKTKEFFNSVNWKFVVKDTSEGPKFMNVSAKIFPNGKFQFAGFRTIKACAVIPHIVLNYIISIPESIKNSNGEFPKILETQVHMINSSFNFFTPSRVPEHLINQKKLTDIIHNTFHISKGGCIRHAEPPSADYPGMNVKYLSKKWQVVQEKSLKKKPEGQISILLFNSGSTIITGGKNFSEYKEVYDWIRTTVSDHEAIVVQDPQEWEKKEKKIKAPLNVPDFKVLDPIISSPSNINKSVLKMTSLSDTPLDVVVPSSAPPTP